MIITGHGASLGAKRNKENYFELISNFSVDAIEVDVRKRGGELYLAHLPVFFPKTALPLERAFEYCLEKGVKVNLDVKEFGIIKDICALAERMNVGQYIYFTGRIMPSDMPYFTCGDAYVNEEFYAKQVGLPSKGNLAKIKSFLDSFNEPRIRGINTGYRKADGDYMNEAKKLGLGLSLYTVDSPKALQTVIALQPDNITTNRPDLALAIVGEKIKY